MLPDSALMFSAAKVSDCVAQASDRRPGSPRSVLPRPLLPCRQGRDGHFPFQQNGCLGGGSIHEVIS